MQRWECRGGRSPGHCQRARFNDVAPLVVRGGQLVIDDQPGQHRLESPLDFASDLRGP